MGQQHSSNGARTGNVGLQVGSISIGLFGFILAGVALIVCAVIACCSTPRFRRSFIDSPLNPNRPPPSRSQPHHPTRSNRESAVRALNGEHPWFEDPFVRLARERRELDTWRRAVSEEERVLRTRPKMFERQIDGDQGRPAGEDDLPATRQQRQQQRLPLGALLVRPPSSLDSIGPTSPRPTRAIVQTAVLIRLPCAASAAAAVAAAAAFNEKVALQAQASTVAVDDAGDPLDDDELEQQELPELEFGLAYLELEGEWP